jgi:putative acetyltransferase
MAVRDDMIGQGIGSALMKANIDLADNYLQVTRFYLEVWSDNEPAINLYQKFGFEIEGTNVNFGFRDGKFADAYTMARIKK